MNRVVLVVDRDAQTVEWVRWRRYVTDVILHARDGAEALRLLNIARFDHVVVGELDDMTAAEVTRAARRLDARRGQAVPTSIEIVERDVEDGGPWGPRKSSPPHGERWRRSFVLDADGRPASSNRITL